MEQTKPLFIIQKYKSVMRAALAIETVVYLISLTDTLVAGNMISQEALIAIGLMSPFQFAAVFIAAVINSGTMLNYTRSIGSYDARRANEIFSHGCIMALGYGVLFAVIMMAVKGSFIAAADVSAQTKVYLSEYYNIIIWYYLSLPVCTVFDNTVMNTGGEKLSSVVNIVQTVSNVLLSVLFSRFFGVRGIAAATLLCQLGVIAAASVWLLKKGILVRPKLPFSKQSILAILRDGFGRSVIYAMMSLTTAFMNMFTLRRFGTDAVTVFVVVKKILDIALLFMGVAQALQPFIGTLREEKNTKAERYLMHTAVRYLLITGAAVSLLVIVLAPLIAAAFGLRGGMLGPAAVRGVRIAGATLIVRAPLMLLFIYYFLTYRRLPMYLIALLNELVFPVALAILGAAAFGSQEGIWTGIAAAPVLTMAVCAWFVRRIYGKERFPLLLPPGDESRIHIYDFPLTAENSAVMAETAGKVLASFDYPAKTRILAEMLVEEMCMLISDKNGRTDGKLSVECTIIPEDNGARLILRDTGVVFDITDREADIVSLRQYIVAQMMTVPKQRQYIASAGYNRSEFYFTK